MAGTSLGIARYPIAIVAGVCLGLAFAPTSWWPLAFIGVAALTWLVTGVSARRAAGLGFSFGVGLFVTTCSWVDVLGWWVAVLLVVALSLFPTGMALVIWAVRTLPGWPVWVACAWSMMEYASCRFPFGGFGWTRLAFTTVDQPLSGFLGWIGVAGVSWLVALSANLLLVIVWQASVRRRLLALGCVGALFAIGGGLARIPLPEASEQVSIGIVQGNVDGSGGSSAMGYARSVTNNHLSQTVTLMAKARSGQAAMPDFVVWPENSTDVDPTKDPATNELIQTSIQIAQRPILVGAVMAGPGPGERQTSALWWDPALGPTARYDKRNLVPFGEYIPFRQVLLPLIPILEEVGDQSVPGTQPGVLPARLNDGRQLLVGDVICFELAYDATVYDTVRHGAQVLVVQSNNATYTRTQQPHQQFQITRVRAMEARREIVVATTSSLSGMIAADGTVVAKTREATAAADSYRVPLRQGASAGVLLGPWTEAIAALGGAAGVLWAIVIRRLSAAAGPSPARNRARVTSTGATRIEGTEEGTRHDAITSHPDPKAAGDQRGRRGADP